MNNPTDRSVNQRFSSRMALLLSALGVAVGTGNIWRFPRIAAQNGGEHGAGALIFAWVIFLFAWSIPLIITEYLVGKRFRSGVILAFTRGLGKKFSWMGGFVGVVALGISFFYAVVVGWAFYYFVYFLVTPLPGSAGSSLLIWDHFQGGIFPWLFHFMVVVLGGMAILKGVRSIERVNFILIPALILIILFAVLKTLFLPGAWEGIGYLFKPDWNQLAQPGIWLQALTQNAWDTGAGWGLFLTYAAYMKAEHGTVKNAFITGIGNNTISILMAIMIFGTVFSILQYGGGFTDSQVMEVMKTSGPASTGLTFVWLPQLFAGMHAGRLLAILFFMGLTFAGFSSLISMYELGSRVFIDMGLTRNKSVRIIVLIAFLAGLPSVADLNFLSNQDYVWGIGLIISGVFIALLAGNYGIRTLRSEFDYSGRDWIPGTWWNVAVKYFLPVSGTLLILWWLFLSATVFAPGEWYNPFNPFSVMTCIVQWGLAIVLLLIFNRWLVGKVMKRLGD